MRRNSRRSRSLRASTSSLLTSDAAGSDRRSESVPALLSSSRLRLASAASFTFLTSLRETSRCVISAMVERSMPTSSPRLRWSIFGFW